MSDETDKSKTYKSTNFTMRFDGPLAYLGLTGGDRTFGVPRRVFQELAEFIGAVAVDQAEQAMRLSPLAPKGKLVITEDEAREGLNSNKTSLELLNEAIDRWGDGVCGRKREEKEKALGGVELTSRGLEYVRRDELGLSFVLAPAIQEWASAYDKGEAKALQSTPVEDLEKSMFVRGEAAADIVKRKKP